MSDRPQSIPSTRVDLVVAVGVQVLVALVLVVVPIGFDHASSWGLEFNDLIALVLCYLGASAYGFVAAAMARKPGVIMAQALLFLATILGMMIKESRQTKAQPEVQFIQELPPNASLNP